jgi:hypothetical protein
VTRRIRRVASSVVLAIALLAGERSGEERITRVVFTTVQSPTFGGTSFDAVGPYEKLAGRAATYTGWALRASAFAGNDLCDAAGQQIPFLRTGPSGRLPAIRDRRSPSATEHTPAT